MLRVRGRPWGAGPARRRKPESRPAVTRSEAGSADPLFWRLIRTIARVRVLLALVTALVVFLDPNLPPSGHWLRIVAADGNVLLIILYALWIWRLQSGPAPAAYLPRLATWLDVLFSAALIGSTGAHQSPFYLWIVFTIVSAALKSGWQTALRVSLAELVLYLYVALSLPTLGHSEFVLLGFLARTLLLFAIALVLAHLGQRLQEQNRMLAGLHRAATHMSASRSVGELLGRVADSLTDLLEVEQAAVAAGEEDARPVLVNISREQGELLLRLARHWIAAARPAAGPVTIVSNAPAVDPRFAGAGDALSGVRSLLITRLPGSSACSGVLVACNRRGRERSAPAPPTPLRRVPARAAGGPAGYSTKLDEASGRGFSPADQELAELLAAQAGPLLETARLQEQRRSHAGADERRRIAAELHDGLIQTLASMDLRLLTSGALWQGRQWEPLGEELRALKSLAEEALVEARGAVNELAPAHLRQEGLVAYLEDLVRQFQERAAVPVAASLHLAEAGSARVPEPAALLLIGLLREGLNNIRKHAHASQVFLSVMRSGDWITFRLADDGAGFHPELTASLPARTRHYGLAYLRERVAASGGELWITSRPGEGTVIEARLPLLTEERLTSLRSSAEE